MKKHKLNIFPEAKAEDYARLLDDIRANGFDPKQPVTLYEGEVLDGWNRTKACAEIGIQPPTVAFTGTDADAIAFVMRTNKRRNLNSGQWACIAAEADDLLAAIAEEVSKNVGGRPAKPKDDEKPRQKIAEVSPDNNKTATKAAEVFNTNRTYVNQAVKMKEKAPEVFEKVKAGKMTMQDANKAVRAIPTNPWLPDEEERKAKVESGQAVIANAQRDKNLIQWADRKGLMVRVDRGSLFGNPFILDDDGGRDEVCDAYRDHYLPFKPSILRKLPTLKGKVLVCHCYPLQCHAENLASWANEDGEPKAQPKAAQTESCWTMAQNFIASLRPLKAWQERQALADVIHYCRERIGELDKLNGREKPEVTASPPAAEDNKLSPAEAARLAELEGRIERAIKANPSLANKAT
jgi:hypothetical protein